MLPCPRDEAFQTAEVIYTHLDTDLTDIVVDLRAAISHGLVNGDTCQANCHEFLRHYYDMNLQGVDFVAGMAMSPTDYIKNDLAGTHLGDFRFTDCRDASGSSVRRDPFLIYHTC
jgi:hypothetical protein